MSSSPIGIYSEQLAKREGAVRGLSPAARHQAFPKVYAKPIPRPSMDDAVMGTEMKRLSAALDDALQENEGLKRRNQLLTDDLARLRATTPIAPARCVSVGSVLRVYCDALADCNYEIDGTPYTLHDLSGPRRARNSAWPRHVAMWLCRRLCKSASFPVIARHFGNRDHTSIMHGCERAPFIMDSVPELRAAALVVLATFETKGGPA